MIPRAVVLAVVLAAAAGAEEAGWRESLEGATVPDEEARGAVHGLPFVVEKAEMKEGILELRQGKEFFADRSFTVFLFLGKGESPAGKKWAVKRDKQWDNPHIHMGWMEGGKGIPETHMAMSKYAMILEFGAETNKTVPGKIWLCMDDESKSWVAGTFTCGVKGFRMVDGKADLTEDSFLTLEWLAAEWLRDKNGGERPEILTHSDGQYANTDGKNAQEGRCAYRWKGKDGKVSWIKLDFRKEVGKGWEVVGSRPGDEIEQAHPKEAPDFAKDPDKALVLASALRLEKELHEAHPGTAILSTWFMPQVPTKGSLGTCDLSWSMEQAEGEWAEGKSRRELWVKAEGAWKFERLLEEGERLNWGTGEIEKK
jgi:hypothetical protein